MSFVFTRMPGWSYCRQLRSLLLCLCDSFRALINSLSVVHLYFGSIFIYSFERLLSESSQDEPKVLTMTTVSLFCASQQTYCILIM